MACIWTRRRDARTSRSHSPRLKVVVKMAASLYEALSRVRSMPYSSASSSRSSLGLSWVELCWVGGGRGSVSRRRAVEFLWGGSVHSFRLALRSFSDAAAATTT